MLFLRSLHVYHENRVVVKRVVIVSLELGLGILVKRVDEYTACRPRF